MQNYFLRNLGNMRNIDANIANFSGIFKSPVPSYLGDAAMKFVFEIDEEGVQTAESSGQLKLFLLSIESFSSICRISKWMSVLKVI